MGLLVDGFGRAVRNARISLTDRCNLRCTYCMPANPEWLPRADILSFEEIERFARVAIACGITEFRLTGGEPLVRHGVADIVRRLAALPGLTDLAMTTNGILLEQFARPLREAGLMRLNVSLDTLREEKFQHITRRPGYERVIAGLRAATEAGFHPIKVNAVVVRGFNDDEIVELAEAARQGGWQLRFIEFMPLDGDRQWHMEKVVPAAEIRAKLSAISGLVPVEPDGPDPARLYRYEDGRGDVGIIASVTEPFCASCDRVRLTADGRFRTCLFATWETDLRGPMRSGASDDDLAKLMADAVTRKEAGHLINRPGFIQPTRAMNAIGG